MNRTVNGFTLIISKYLTAAPNTSFGIKSFLSREANLFRRMLLTRTRQVVYVLITFVYFFLLLLTN